MTVAFGSIKTHEPEFYKGVTSRERTIYRPRRHGSKGNPPKKGRGRKSIKTFSHLSMRRQEAAEQ